MHVDMKWLPFHSLHGAINGNSCTTLKENTTDVQQDSLNFPIIVPWCHRVVSSSVSLSLLNVSICMQLLGCCSWSVLCFAQTGALGKKYNENYYKKRIINLYLNVRKNDPLFAIKRIYLQCVFAVTVTALIHLQPVLRFSGTWYRSCFDSYKFNVFILETFVLNKNNIWQERTILTLKR